VAPGPVERAVNKAFGVLLGLGVGRRHNYLLQVRGRTTGVEHATPINVLELNGRRWLVAGRGRTHWVRNAEVAGEVFLQKGKHRRRYRIRAVADADKPAILSAYLSRFKLTVQRYFPLRAGAPPSAFAVVASRYPVFELIETDA
jgi:hypothetical protein